MTIHVHINPAVIEGMNRTAEQLGEQMRRAIERAASREFRVTRPAVEVPIIRDEPDAVWIPVGDLQDSTASPIRINLIWAGEHGFVGKCDACTTDGRVCRRINQCLRYKCEFGKVDKP